MRKSPYIQSVDKALNILELFKDNEQLGITDIKNKLSYDKAVIYKIVITLENHGFLKQIPENKKYRLGSKAFELVSQYLSYRSHIEPLLHNSYPLLQKLTHKTNCTAQLGILEEKEQEILIVASVESPALVKVSASLGEKIPIYASAVGKCMLAFSDAYLLDNLLSHELKPLTSKTITDKKKLLAELEKVKEQGYALSDEEWEVGVVAIACPVFDYMDKCIASLLVSFPAYKKELYTIEDLVDTTKDYSGLLSQHSKRQR